MEKAEKCYQLHPLESAPVNLRCACVLLRSPNASFLTSLPASSGLSVSCDACNRRKKISPTVRGWFVDSP